MNADRLVRTIVVSLPQPWESGRAEILEALRNVPRRMNRIQRDVAKARRMEAAIARQSAACKRPEMISPLDVLEVRSLLVLRGTTLNAWAISRGWCGQYAHLAVHGKRRGPKARMIVEALKAELGV